MPSQDPFHGNSITGLLDCAMDSSSPSSAAQNAPVKWQAPDAKQLAVLLPQFEIECLIGLGGMGAVYKGKQPRLNRTVAIKILPAEIASEEFVARFEREAQMLASLNHHGIVIIHDSGQTHQGHLYIVMEYVDGTNLQDIIHKTGISAAQALDITIQVCEALHYAHQQGIVHRDVKPANVLLTRLGKAKLVDFGLARPLDPVIDGSITSLSRVVGTPEYMAPEQWIGVADHRTDIYALGVTLYEMLTKTRPQGKWQPASVKAEVDVRLDEVISKAMSQEPEDRYQEVSEMKREVHHISTTNLQRRPRLPRKVIATSKRSVFDSIAWALLVLIIIGLGVGGYYLSQQSRANALETAALEPKEAIEQSAAPLNREVLFQQANLELSQLEASMNEQRSQFKVALDTLNRLTDFKRKPVKEGSQAYLECLAASKVIKAIETGAPQKIDARKRLQSLIEKLSDPSLTERITKLEANAKALQSSLSSNSELPAGTTPTAAPDAP